MQATELNMHPINQSAMKRLLEEGILLTEILQEEPRTMAVLQLAMMGLEENEIDDHFAIQSARINQERTLRWLSESLDAEELEEGTPLDAALMVRNILRPPLIRV